MVVGLLVLPFIFAEVQTLGTFKQNDCIELKQICSNCSYNYIQVLYPNSSIALNTIIMSKNGNYYNTTFCQTSINGKYISNGVGNLNGINTTWTYDYYITATGSDFNIAKAVSYILIFFVSLLVFVGLLIMGLYIPVSNSKDEMTGYILAINNLKYLKLVMIGFAYIMAVFISYFSWMVCFAYLDMNFVSDIFRFIFYALAYTTLPLFILFTYLTITNLVRDSQIGDMLSRGLHTTGERI